MTIRQASIGMLRRAWWLLPVIAAATLALRFLTPSQVMIGILAGAILWSRVRQPVTISQGVGLMISLALALCVSRGFRVPLAGLQLSLPLGVWPLVAHMFRRLPGPVRSMFDHLSAAWPPLTRIVPIALGMVLPVIVTAASSESVWIIEIAAFGVAFAWRLTSDLAPEGASSYWGPLGAACSLAYLVLVHFRILPLLREGAYEALVFVGVPTARYLFLLLFAWALASVAKRPPQVQGGVT